MNDPLYISDLDGTLLASDGELSPYSRDVLQELIDDGLCFTVASARSVVSIRERIGGLRLHLPVITLNGAYISDLRSGRHAVINSISPDVVEEIHDLLGASGHVPFVSTWSGSDERVYYAGMANAGMAWYVDDCRRRVDERWRHVADLREAYREQVMCLTVIAEPGALDEVEIAVRERYGSRVETHFFENIYSPGWHWLTIHDHRATKDQAIAELIDGYDLGGRELVVFGDQTNDLGMFGVADRAVAVANACDELRDAATHHIGSNDDDSVATFIRAERQAMPGTSAE